MVRVYALISQICTCSYARARAGELGGGSYSDLQCERGRTMASQGSVDSKSGGDTTVTVSHEPGNSHDRHAVCVE